MATYYWVGGSGTFSYTSTANWATTSGGAGGKGPPTSVDDVRFDANSSTTDYTVTVSGGVAAQNVFIDVPSSGNV